MMAKTGKKGASERWIILDKRQQANCNELIAMLATVENVKIEQKARTVRICFPERKLQEAIMPVKYLKIKKAKPSLLGYARRDYHPLYFIKQTKKTDDKSVDSQHYSAIMLK